MIAGEDIERAERHLMRPIGIDVPAAAPQFSRAQVKQEDFDNFLKHHHDTLVKHAPDMDPRFDGVINVMLRHFFLVGVLAGRTDRPS